MGCICSKPTINDNDELQNKNNIIPVEKKISNELEINSNNDLLPGSSSSKNDVINSISSNIINSNYNDYPEKLLNIINYIRQNPKSYSSIIEQSIKNIIEEQDKIDPNKKKLVYKQKVKVALVKGIPAFKEAVIELNETLPMRPLVFREEICLPLPNTEKELFDHNFLKENIRPIMEKHQISVFFKDMVKIPEVSALLMIVDDSGKNICKKRKALLNPEFEYIGIRSKFIGKYFIAFLSFSKNLEGNSNRDNSNSISN